MSNGYQIVAYSLTVNESIQELDLENPQPITDPVYAQRRADTWALRLNQQQHMRATDWQGKIRYIDLPGGQGPMQGV
jgi:hypothetical protein